MNADGFQDLDIEVADTGGVSREERDGVCPRYVSSTAGQLGDFRPGMGEQTYGSPTNATLYCSAAYGNAKEHSVIC